MLGSGRGRAPVFMTTPDEIHISNLALNVRVGVTDEEQAQPQRLTVSLTLRPARGFDGLEDRIENTVNYAAVCAAVRVLVAGHPRRLIETLALDIAGEILARFAVVSVDVELRKYILPDTDYVAVRLSRSRPL